MTAPATLIHAHIARDPRTHVVDADDPGRTLCDRSALPVESVTPWTHTGRPIGCSRCSARAFTVRAHERYT